MRERLREQAFRVLTDLENQGKHGKKWPGKVREHKKKNLQKVGFFFPDFFGGNLGLSSHLHGAGNIHI